MSRREVKLIERKVADLNFLDAAARFSEMGVAGIVFSEYNTPRMDTLCYNIDVNCRGLRALTKAASVPIIANIGLGSLEDLRRLRGLTGNIRGAIVGKSLAGAKDVPINDVFGAAPSDLPKPNPHLSKEPERPQIIPQEPSEIITTAVTANSASSAPNATPLSNAAESVSNATKYLRKMMFG